MLKGLGKYLNNSKNVALLLVLSFWQILFPLAAAQPVYAANDKVTICHRTDAATNPYQSIEVDQDSVDGLSNEKGNQADHYGEHTGPVFNPTIHNQQNRGWGDIIPPIAGVHTGLNWTTEGQAIYNNDCKVVTQEVETGSVTVNKQVDIDGDGTFEVTSNSEANTLGFRWGLDSDPTNNLMGSTQDGVSVGSHDVNEKDVNGYHFAGWFSGDGSCTSPDGTTLPSVNVTADNTSEVTLCNAADNIDLSQVTICHRTDAVNNPYEKITVDASAVDGEGNNDHTSHTGPVATSEAVAQSLKDNHENWGDIIPPTDNDPDGYNWTTEGQAVYNNDCKYVVTQTESGTITVNKQVDTDRDGVFEGGNSAANSLGFKWLLDDETTGRDMGTSAETATGSHQVDENDVSGYHFAGWFSGEGTCTDPEHTSLPASVDVATDQTSTITLCNAADAIVTPSAVMTIQKMVNGGPSADSTVGGVVTYTLIISVPDSSGTVYNATVTDLPPENFEYIAGSETATTGHISHAYASPGIWSLGTLIPGQIVTLTYKALIKNLVTPGSYPDLAFASGFSDPGAGGSPDVYSNVHLASVTNPFVGTLVTVAPPAAPGQVLGISTLPSTASAFNILGAILPPAMFGIGYFLLESRRQRNRGRS